VTQLCLTTYNFPSTKAQYQSYVVRWQTIQTVEFIEARCVQLEPYKQKTPTSFLTAWQPWRAYLDLPTVEVSRSHSRHTTLVRHLWTSDRPIAETSTWQHPAGFEPEISASERPQAHTLDRAATGDRTADNLRDVFGDACQWGEIGTGGHSNCVEIFSMTKVATCDYDTQILNLYTSLLLIILIKNAST